MFEDWETTDVNIEWAQHIRLRASIFVELGNWLYEISRNGSPFDTTEQAKILADAEAWLVHAGARLGPLPDSAAMEAMAEIFAEVLDPDGVADQFGDMDEEVATHE